MIAGVQAEGNEKEVWGRVVGRNSACGSFQGPFHGRNRSSGPQPDAVTEAGRRLAGARGVKLLGVGEGALSVALDSGAYTFAW
jgi:hypothetical protein